MDANKAFQMIEKAFSDKRLVLVTDGTVTRRVVSVGLAEKLYIHTETGGWVEIKRSFCGLTLDGWGLLDAAEALYIAPEWWIANGTDDENGGNENVCAETEKIADALAGDAAAAFDGAFAGGAVRCDVDCLRTRNDDRRP